LGIQGRVALVTGSSQGIGFAVARALVAEGARVAICGRESKRLATAAKKIAAETQKKAAGEPASVVAVEADLAKSEDREALVEVVTRDAGPPEILVLNSGGPPSGSFLDFSAEDWGRNYRSMLESMIHLTRLVAPTMVERRWGRIVALTSIAVKEPIPDLVISNTLRAGVVGFMKTLSRELGPNGVTVNVVAPGLTATERLRELFKARAAREGKTMAQVQKTALTGIPAGRAARPEEIAAAVSFLASERAGFVNGVNLAVDGGMTRSVL
jgi:3-oxoacyl-[acyl-carrier protein] reductase